MSDNLFVNRNNTTYQVDMENLRSVEDTDLLLVNRDGITYTVTGDKIGGGNSGEISEPVEVLTPLNGAGMSDGPITPLSSVITDVGGAGSYVPETSNITDVQNVGVDAPYAGKVTVPNNEWIYSGSSPGFMFDGNTNTSFKIDGTKGGPGGSVTFDCEGIPGFGGGSTVIGLDSDASYCSGTPNWIIRYTDGTQETLTDYAVNITPAKAIKNIVCQDNANSPFNVGWLKVVLDGVELVGNYQIGAATELTLENSSNFNLFKQGNTVKGVAGSAQSAAFSTTIWNGSTGSARAIPTSIDNTSKSLVWIKSRSGPANESHILQDTVRGVSSVLRSNSASEAALSNPSDRVEGFTSTGIIVGADREVNYTGYQYVAWNFRAAPGFFDVVTYEGIDGSGQTVPHSLGSEPGMIIIKAYEGTTSANWYVYHKELGYDKILYLNNANQEFEYSDSVTAATANDFTVGVDNNVTGNDSSWKLVAYLFADTPGKIKCGTWGYQSRPGFVETGFKVGWVLFKSADSNDPWYTFDTARGMVNNGSNQPDLKANTSDSDANSFKFWSTDTGFGFDESVLAETGYNYIYVAIAEDATAGEFPPTGELLEDANSTTKKINLINTTGTWETGNPVSKEAIDAALELTFQSTANLDLMVGTVTMTDENGDVKVPETSAITNVTDIPGGWNAASAGEAITWRSVTYGNGKFVAFSSGGNLRLMYSTDGISWTAKSAQQNNPWQSVTYGNGKFVTVATTGGNQVEYSADGISWTSVSAARDNPWYSVTYGNGKFVAVAYSGINPVMYSTDGINWTDTSAPAGSWYSVTYGDGKFVAVSGNGSNLVMYSTDGISWTATAAAEDNNWYSVTYGGDKFVAVAADGTNRVMYSTDGISWTATAAAEANPWQSVTYGDGKFVAVSGNGSNRVMYSTDGISWTVASAAEANDWWSVTYGDGKFVAVASDGTNRVMWSLTGADASTELTLTDSQELQYFKAGDTVTGEASATETAAFSTTLYTGNSGTQTINTGIDNTGKALVWAKNTDTSLNHLLFDTERGVEDYLKSNSTEGSRNSIHSLQEFTNSGFTTGPNGELNGSGNMVAWNFRAAPGFMDIITWTGTDGNANRVLNHSLNSVPGFVICKAISIDGTQWYMYHKELGLDSVISFNDEAASSIPAAWNSVTTTTFGLGTGANLNAAGRDQVAYLFADTPGLIKCGSYNGNNSSQTINVGFDCAWVLIKRINGTAEWVLVDNKRGSNVLKPNESDSESSEGISLVSNGFSFAGGTGAFNDGNGTYLYVAIAEGATAGDFAATGTLVADADVSTNTMNVVPISGTFETGGPVTGSEVTASATDVMYVDGNKVGLSGVVPTWISGLYMQGATVTDYGPSPDSVTYTSMNAGSTKYTGIDSNLLSRTWTLQYRAVETDPWATVGVYEDTSVVLNQDGATPWPDAPTLQPNAYYQVKVKYNASNADPVESVYATFKTAAS